MAYRCCFAVYRHEEQRMKRPIGSEQSDLFFARATLPQSLPAVMRAELVSLLSALLLEVISPQQHIITARKEVDHEQQDHA
jgi:hypothetical protein